MTEKLFQVQLQTRKFTVKQVSLPEQMILMKNLIKLLLTKSLNKRVANDIAPQQKTLPGLDNPRSLDNVIISGRKRKNYS